MRAVGESGDFSKEQDCIAHRLPTDRRIRPKANKASFRNRTQEECGCSDRQVPSGGSVDIPLLAQHFLDFYASENGLAPRKLSADALRTLIDYEWPGNVRELENAIERGVVLSSGAVIGSDLLPGHITGRSFQDALMEHNPDATLFDILEDIERRIIVEKLERCNWNQTEAAEQFHIPLSTLNQKIKRLNIEIRKKGRE